MGKLLADHIHSLIIVRKIHRKYQAAYNSHVFLPPPPSLPLRSSYIKKLKIEEFKAKLKAEHPIRSRIGKWYTDRIKAQDQVRLSSRLLPYRSL